MADSEFRPIYRGPRRNVAGPVEPVYSGTGADPRDPQPLRTGLETVAQKHGWGTSLEVGAVIGRWHDLVGPHVAAHCSPEKFEPPVLVVRASSTTWATQLRIMTRDLLDRLERELGSRVVEELTILGPTQRSWKHGRRSVAGRGPRDTYG
ncbi:hypothetical protein GCM10022261_00950 [Brevibacterium daeguense]|uniref:DUF721 domain-containing protein n=2 Tax=Brevibacterium daeguense TaxID=909936 RepID=A0ABP8EF03_9MICO